MYIYRIKSMQFLQNVLNFSGRVSFRKQSSALFCYHVGVLKRRQKFKSALASLSHLVTSADMHTECITKAWLRILLVKYTNPYDVSYTCAFLCLYLLDHCPCYVGSTFLLEYYATISSVHVHIYCCINKWCGAGGPRGNFKWMSL